MKKKNPNDTTFRNINALKKRVKELEAAHADGYRLLVRMNKRLIALEKVR